MKLIVNGEVAQIPTGGSSISGDLPVLAKTLAEYEALSDAEKQADVAYLITDDNDSVDSGGEPTGGSSYEIYSENETRIGTYLGKPLYRLMKYIPGSELTDPYSESTLYEIPDVYPADADLKLEISGYVVDRTSMMLIINAPHPTTNVYLSAIPGDIGSRVIQYWGKPRTLSTAIGIWLCVTYTKTTDEPEVTS